MSLELSWDSDEKLMNLVVFVLRPLAFGFESGGVSEFCGLDPVREGAVIDSFDYREWWLAD